MRSLNIMLTSEIFMHSIDETYTKIKGYNTEVQFHANNFIKTLTSARCLVVMHRYHFLATNPIPMLFR